VVPCLTEWLIPKWRVIPFLPKAPYSSAVALASSQRSRAPTYLKGGPTKTTQSSR